MNPTPRLTRQQARAIDRICIEDFGVPGIVLMENAARVLLDAARDMLDAVGGRRVLIVCGGRNNGGDGYALARHLDNAGFTVVIAAAIPLNKLTGDAATNATICQQMGLTILQASPTNIGDASSDLIVDALFGTGLDAPPRADAAALIRAMNARPEPILAVDVPSGLDCDTGQPLGGAADCIRATRTVTMVAEKTGFSVAREWTGAVSVGDIGAPRAAIAQALTRSAGSGMGAS